MLASIGRSRILMTLAGLAGAALLLALLAVAWKEPHGTNSYSLLADAFLHGRLDVASCFDVDCARYGGKIWVIFPPAPAIVAMPFVAAFGTGFAGYIPLSLILSGVTLWLWWRIFRTVGLEPAHAGWLIVAIAFATPLYYITIRGNGVWFFAQVVGTLAVTAAIHEALARRLLTAGLAIGLAFLSRQLTILIAPFIFALALDANERLISFRSDYLRRAATFALPIAIAIAVYLLYNALRFGNPMETGYAYIATTRPDDPSAVTYRIQEIGLFSARYALVNAFYFLVQGFHVDFVGRYMTELGKLDPFGTSIIAASPFLLLAFFAPMRRAIVIGLGIAAVMVIFLLFYHSNGFTQYNTQRYTLDWLPVIFLALALGPAREHAGAFRLLVVYAMLRNLAAMGVLALTVGR
jgi:hypothetical protein